MNMNYNDLTTIFRSILTQIYVFLASFTIFNFDLEKFISKNCKYIFFSRNVYILGENTSKYCSRIFVVHVHETGLFYYYCGLQLQYYCDTIVSNIYACLNENIRIR